MTLEVRRAGDRFVTRSGGRTTWHSFSFGPHYDPANIGVGALLAHNDEHLPPGTGYDEHRHRDVEIVSVVLEGSLRHGSDVGEAVLGPGDVQRLSAGSGVTHREWSALGPDEDESTTRFVQAWLRPRATGGTPSYAVLPGVLPGDGLALIETGADTDAVLHAGSLLGGRSADLPEASDRRRHLFVASGAVDVSLGDRDVAVGAGDAVLTGGDALTIRADTPAVVLIWTTSPD